jgi:hypothetical protein
LYPVDAAILFFREISCKTLDPVRQHE